ncbi:MAG TPA: hypothetical protein VGI45_03460 [Terracidiphilus sp.]|jgi:hypothetical protein
MYQHVLNFFGIGILSAVLAAGTIIANAMRIDKDPAVDGPRALLAEFFGLWIAFAFLAWSFMITGPEVIQWILRGIAGCAAILAFALAAYFAGTPEVDMRLDEEPTGFDVPITALQLQKLEVLSLESLSRDEVSSASTPATARRDRTWSELNS